MKLKLLITFFLLFSFSNNYAQYSNANFQKLRDSLQTLPSYDTASFFKIITQLKRISTSLKSPQKQADILHVLGTYYYFRTDENKAKLYYDSALNILKNNPDQKLKNLIELKRSYIWLNKGEFNKAKRFYKEKELSEKNDTMAQILINMALGQIYQAEQRHDSSLNKMYKALNLSVAKKDLYYEATTRNNIAGEYQILGKTEDAKKEYLTSINIAKKIKNKKLVSNINSNIASIYLSENKIQDALEIYKENLSFYLNTNFHYEIAYMYLNISICYSKLNNTALMKKYSQQAINIITHNNLPLDAIDIYSQASNLYLSNNLYKEQIGLCKEAIAFSEKYNVPIINPQFYNNLSKAYEFTNDPFNALQMNKKYIYQKDSLDKISNDKLVNELVFKHQLTEKEQKILFQQNENKLLKKENELYSLNKKYYIVIIIMILIVSILLGFFILERRIKKQKEIYAGQLINEIDKDRERIAMDLHDDLGLGITMARQKILKAEIKDGETKTDIEKNLMNLLEKTRKISRDLFPSTIKHLSFTEFISDLLNNTEKETGIISSYEIHKKIDNFNLDTKTHILRILQECIHNTIKYSEASAIRVEVEDINNKKTQITYYDNGIGFKETIKGKGLGLKNIYQRCLLIKADVVIANNENNIGVKLTLTLHDKT